MFEQAIFEYMRDNFTVSGFTLHFGFGKIADKTVSPYIIQYNLDTNGDRDVLCNNDDFTDGEAFIQWNIYCTSPTNAFYIKTELMKFIANLEVLTLNTDTYLVEINEHSNSPSGIDENTGLFVEVVARDITYNKQ